MQYIEKKTKEKSEGETCGWCYNPGLDNDCGTCKDGLDCSPDPLSSEIPDIPNKCTKSAEGELNKN